MQTSAAARFYGHFFSVVFHPLLIAGYTFAFLVYIHPDAFSGIDPHIKLLRLLTVLLNTVGFPAFTLFLTWRLKFLHSLKMQTREDRIIAFLTTMIFYWWAWWVMRNLTDLPPVAVRFLLGSFLGICGGWMCNLFYKISMHAIAMGGLFAFFVLLCLGDPYGSGLYLSIVTLIAGAVCTARLIISDHSYFEIVTGLGIGILAQIIAWQF